MNSQSTKSDALLLDRLYEVIQKRKFSPAPDSYVASLLLKGTSKIHEKIREEAGELIEASELEDRAAIVHESADLIFHMLILLGHRDIRPDEIYGELSRRWGISGVEEKRSRTAKQDEPGALHR